jgi:hypothetical protein
MNRKTIKLVREGEYAAELEVELITDETGWSPYLSGADAEKLDRLRRALAQRDLKAAISLARVVYHLESVAA